MTDYRYTLTRTTGRLGNVGRLCWVMLNPSTADDTTDDPTIRRVIRFTADATFAELVVVNLFAARATKPAALAAMHDPVGPDWEAHVDAAMARSDAVVFAWGASTPRHIAELARRQQRQIREIAHGLGHRPRCLGTTANGSPLHPLYIPADQPLIPFPLEVAA